MHYIFKRYINKLWIHKKDFSNIYNKYVDTPKKKVYAEQIDVQLKASALLREMSEREGYSQHELVKKVGKPQSTISCMKMDQ